MCDRQHASPHKWDDADHGCQFPWVTSSHVQHYQVWSSHVCVFRRLLWLVVTKTVDGHVVLLKRGEKFMFCQIEWILDLREVKISGKCTWMNIGMSNSVELITESSSFTWKNISSSIKNQVGSLVMLDVTSLCCVLCLVMLKVTSWMLCFKFGDAQSYLVMFCFVVVNS